jgi:hypothetical protein
VANHNRRSACKQLLLVNTNNYTIQSFDEKAYTQVSSLKLNGLLGTPIAFVRWGTSRLAVLTTNGGNRPTGMIYLVQDSSFVTNTQTGRVSHVEGTGTRAAAVETYLQGRHRENDPQEKGTLFQASSRISVYDSVSCEDSALKGTRRS